MRNNKIISSEKNELFYVLLGDTVCECIMFIYICIFSFTLMIQKGETSVDFV